jgi:hypothetical protein
VKCPKCNAEVDPSFKFCVECAAKLPAADAPAGANIALEGSVAKDVAQQASGPGGASVSVKDSVVRDLTQEGSGGGDEAADAEKLSRLGDIRLNVDGSVIRNVNIVQHLHLDGAESIESIQGGRRAGQLKVRMIYAACGSEIRAFNPRAQFRESEPVRVYTLPDETGGARSVRLAKVGDRLWILAGARCGVVAFDAETAEAKVFLFPTVTRYGANSVTVLGDYVYASHSDLGLLRWPIVGGKPTEMFPDLFRGLTTVRGVQASRKGQLLLCGHCSVYRIDLDQPGGRPVRYSAAGVKELVGAVECGNHLYAATLEGKVLRWETEVPGGPDLDLAHLDCKTYCVSLVQMPDGPHLVLGAKVPALTLVKLAPPYSRAQYLTAGASVRWAQAASDLLVASDSDCLRLLCWSREVVHRPEREILVGRAPRDQVVDFCLLSQ